MNISDPVTIGIVTAGALQLAKQAQDFIGATFGHPGESLATILGNAAHRRFHNAETVASKAHLILLNIGIAPREVPLNVIQPMIEGASLQEDPSLQEIWANMLANAADPRKPVSMRAAFPGMLKDLTSRDVKLLEAAFNHVTRDSEAWKLVAERTITKETLQRIYAAAGLSRHEGLGVLSHGDWTKRGDDIKADLHDFGCTVAMAVRLGILDAKTHVQRMSSTDFLKGLQGGPADVDIRQQTIYSFTELGVAFLTACRPPRL